MYSRNFFTPKKLPPKVDTDLCGPVVDYIKKRSIILGKGLFIEKKIIQNLIAVEIKLGFLHIPAKGIDQMPDRNAKIPVTIDAHSKTRTYNPTYKRIFGLPG